MNLLKTSHHLTIANIVLIVITIVVGIIDYLIDGHRFQDPSWLLGVSWLLVFACIILGMISWIVNFVTHEKEFYYERNKWWPNVSLTILAIILLVTNLGYRFCPSWLQAIVCSRTFAILLLLTFLILLVKYIVYSVSILGRYRFLRKYLPQEVPESQRELYESVREEVDKRAYDLECQSLGVNDGKYYRGMCHGIWYHKKRILKEEYGIDWLSPADLDPDTRFE